MKKCFLLAYDQSIHIRRLFHFRIFNTTTKKKKQKKNKKQNKKKQQKKNNHFKNEICMFIDLYIYCFISVLITLVISGLPDYPDIVLPAQD